MSENEPKIIGFCCNWCCYGGADTAGTARMQYPPNVRIVGSCVRGESTHLWY
jgi:F420-non-reducing hydrogenase iron-sulfur subunit